MLLHGSAPGVSVAEAWRRADARFLWNGQFLEDFVAVRESLPGLDEWVTPVINGFIECHRVDFGADAPAMDMIVISRRSRHRQGTRFYRRGIDTYNDVANFVETEELLLHPDGTLTSFVQVRGSIPVFWSQEPSLMYTPKCTLNQAYTADKVRRRGLPCSCTHVLCCSVRRVLGWGR
jgi:hypothetical protein